MAGYNPSRYKLVNGQLSSRNQYYYQKTLNDEIPMPVKKPKTGSEVSLDSGATSSKSNLEFDKRAIELSRKKAEIASTSGSLVLDKKKLVQQWRDIAEEGTLDDVTASLYKAGKIARHDDQLQERGAEQYLNRCLRKRKLDENPRPKFYESDSEISNDGLSDDSLEFVRSKRGFILKKKKLRTRVCHVNQPELVPGPIIKNPETEDSILLKKSNEQCPTVIENSGQSDIKKSDSATLVQAEETTGVPLNIQDKDTHKKEYTQLKSQHLFAKKQLRKRRESLTFQYRDLNDKEFCDKLAYQLKESNRDIIVKAMEALGRNSCLDLLHKTLKIQRNGGIVIKKGTRLRTSGGVFLYLIRHTKKLSEDKKGLVLEDQPQQPLPVGYSSFYNPYSLVKNQNFQNQKKKNLSSLGQKIGTHNKGIHRMDIDLESDKFSTTIIGMAETGTPKPIDSKLDRRSTISYQDIDLFSDSGDFYNF